MTEENTEIQRTAESEAFNLAQREAGAWSSSSLVPAAYQDNVPNVLIAMEMAKRIGASVMAVMQNLHIIHGKPAFGASFLIATVNGSGRFSPIRYRMEGDEGDQSWGCRAYATDRESGEECVGPAVTMAIAKAEGWLGKNGSKWQTMPELMLHYRAAAFWTRVYCPELSMGIHTTEEMEDVAAVHTEPAQIVKPLAELTKKLKTVMDDDADNLPDMKPDPPRDLRVELFTIAERLWPGEAAAGVKFETDKMQCDVDKLTDSEMIRLIGILSGQLKGGK